MNDNELNWLRNLKNNLSVFLERMSENNFSYFKYSFSGDLVDSSKKWGLGNTVFATKILYIANLLDQVETAKRINLSKKILIFNDKKGYIFDPVITETTLKQKFILYLQQSIKNHIENIRRAETRQAFAALYLLNQKPKNIFPNIPYTKEGINNYLCSFDWRFPWDAGSHFSHLLFFLRMNSVLFDYGTEQCDELINYAVQWISKMQSKVDGCWYSGNTTLSQKINGAMKILTGLHVAGIYHFPYTERLIDTALSGTNDSEACSNFNIAYVLYGCNKNNPNYRKAEIQEFMLNRVRLYKEFYHPEQGGFSFFRNKANDVYYGKKISLGKNEPDIHGTALFTWGLAIINSIVDLGLDFRIPIN